MHIQSLNNTKRGWAVRTHALSYGNIENSSLSRRVLNKSAYDYAQRRREQGRRDVAFYNDSLRFTSQKVGLTISFCPSVRLSASQSQLRTRFAKIFRPFNRCGIRKGGGMNHRSPWEDEKVYYFQILALFCYSSESGAVERGNAEAGDWSRPAPCLLRSKPSTATTVSSVMSYSAADD